MFLLYIRLFCLWLALSLYQCKKIATLTTPQFPAGSEHLILPPIVCYSVYMGNVHYEHLPLLLGSMKYNPKVQFNLINIVEDDLENTPQKLDVLKSRLGVSNFVITRIGISKFRNLVFDKLGIDIPFNSSWYYKLCDFKPTLAYLFPELSPEDKYAYWGYVDMDVIWGNFSRYAYLFQGNYPVIISGWWSSNGAATFYSNRQWTKTAFLTEPRYVPLLKNLTYHNLDENGLYTQYQIDGGDASITNIQQRLSRERGFRLLRGNHVHDHLFIDPSDASQWAGVVRWFQGSLQIVHGSQYFPPGRELLFYHRMDKLWNVPVRLKHDLVQDMMTYGFLLPSFVPIFSRLACDNEDIYRWGVTTTQAMESYRPFSSSCFAKKRAIKPE